VLGDYADKLQAWAGSQVLKLWSQVDSDDIRGSWLTIRPAMLEVHRATVTLALEAVDAYMFAKAADAGFRYTVTWREDRPDRINRVYWGQPSDAAISRAPIVVLTRLRDGVDVSDALMFGLNYLLGIMTTEAHEIVRNVTVERVLAQ
jgi:hypothetical protein